MELVPLTLTPLVTLDMVALLPGLVAVLALGALVEVVLKKVDVVVKARVVEVVALEGDSRGTWGLVVLAQLEWWGVVEVGAVVALGVADTVLAIMLTKVQVARRQATLLVAMIMLETFALSGTPGNASTGRTASSPTSALESLLLGQFAARATSQKIIEELS